MPRDVRCSIAMGRPVVNPAVRNLVAAGADQAVAMRATRRQTIRIFQRYRIVSDDDMREALERTQAALGNRSRKAQGHKSGAQRLRVSEDAFCKCARLWTRRASLNWQGSGLEIHDRVTDFGVRISGPPPISRTVSRRSLIRSPSFERAGLACACLVPDPRAMTLRSACSSAAWNAASRAVPVHQPSATLVGVYEAARSVWTEAGARENGTLV
jgi:hypothetical protein